MYQSSRTDQLTAAFLSYSRKAPNTSFINSIDFEMLKEEITDAVVAELDKKYDEHFDKIHNMAEEIEAVSERADYDDEDLYGQVEELQSDIEQIKAEMTIVHQKINRVNIFKSKTTHEFELNNLVKFFRNRSEFMSEHFYCQGEQPKSKSKPKTEAKQTF